MSQILDNTPQLTIVTLTFNNYEELIRTIHSVDILNSTVEHLVINGGSCTKTFSFLQNWNGRSLTEPDNGIADAFNKGIRLATGDAIMFLNSGDVLINPDYPQKAMQILQDDPDANFIHADEIFDDPLSGSFIMKPLRRNGISSNIGDGMPYRHQTMVTRKTVFEKNGYFDTDYITCDYEWICRWEKTIGKAIYVEGPPVVQMDGNGITAKQESKSINEAISIINKHFKHDFQVRYALFQRILKFNTRQFLKKSKMDWVIKLHKRLKYQHQDIEKV